MGVTTLVDTSAWVKYLRDTGSEVCDIVDRMIDYELAAELYSRCRQVGFTPANTNDLLVASVAIGKKVPLLVADVHFEKIATVCSLRLASV